MIWQPKAAHEETDDDPTDNRRAADRALDSEPALGSAVGPASDRFRVPNGSGSAPASSGEGGGRRRIEGQAGGLPRHARRPVCQPARSLPGLGRIRWLGVADPPQERHVARWLQRRLLARVSADAAALSGQNDRGVPQAWFAHRHRRAHGRAGHAHPLLRRREDLEQADPAH